MTIKDLIKELQKLPQDAKVVLWDNKDFGTCIEAFDVQVGHFDGEYLLDEDDHREMNKSPTAHYPDNAIKIS